MSVEDYLFNEFQFDDTFPNWARKRSGDWVYVGWIGNPTSCNATFEELVAMHKISDHGELRAVDVYAQGAVCWILEP